MTTAKDDKTKTKMPPETPAPELPAGSIWNLIENVLRVNGRSLLYGPPGTGKTFAALTAGLTPGQDVFAITMTDETPAAELRGFYVPRGDRFEWLDMAAVRAWRRGGRLVINEINRASGDALSFLFAVLDDPASAVITLPNNETIRPAEGFNCVATMNGDPEDLPAALRDRFVVCLPVEQVHPAALACLPADLRMPASRTVNLKDPSKRLPLRAWLEYARLRPSLGPAMAARAVFADKAGDVSAALGVTGK